MTAAMSRNGTLASDRAAGVDPAVVVRDVEKTYIDEQTGTRVTALSGLSFEVRREEFVCLVGPSGCGKTTFLHMLAGLRPITAGSIVCDGRPVAGPGPDRGMVFQDYALFPWKTVRENIEFGPRLRKVPPAERRRISDFYLEMIGLPEFGDHYPRSLSGGMKQRVAVVRALANQPSVLLMDEPFASVDAITRLQLQEEITRVWAKEHTTVVFVTHSVDEAVFLADRVVVFTHRPGRVKSIHDVRLPRPRIWAEVEHNSEFNAARVAVLESVQAEASFVTEQPTG